MSHTKRLTTSTNAAHPADGLRQSRHSHTHRNALSKAYGTSSHAFQQRALLTALAAVLGAWQGPALAQGRTDTLAVSGQSAPGTRGGTFSSLSAPMINATGQFAFQGLMTGGSSTSGIFSGAADSALTPIALQGLSANGAGSGKFSTFTQPTLNDAGQIAFLAGIAGSNISQGIYRSSSGSAPSALVLQGQSATNIPGFTFSSFNTPVLNSTGATTYIASLAGGSIAEGIFISGVGTRDIALLGQNVGDGSDSRFTGFTLASLNDAGHTAFIAETRNSITNGSGIYRGDLSPAQPRTAIALQGQSANGTGAGTFSSFDNLVLNNAGQTAFRAGIVAGSSSQGIYRSSSGSALTAIALQGQSATGEGSGTFSLFSAPLLNDGGQVAFHASLNGGSSTQGLFMGDGQDVLAVQLTGNTLAGKTVSSIEAPTSGSFNKLGQLAYRAFFSGGGSGNFLFTPDLRWRQAISGAWDTATNWTLGLAPAFVHALKIDPTVSLTVTGPKEAQSVKSLTVGGGNGIATLRLAGGTLTSESAVQIANTGVLTGDGVISGGVSNSGTVRADNLRIDGGLNNSGKILGSGRIAADLTQTAAGQLRVGAGESLLLSGAAHSNAGTIEVRNGGELEVNGAMNQAASGRTLLDNATVRFNNGLTNAGQLNVGFGGASVLGNVVNAAGGKIIVSGNSQATFYDTVEAKAGSELRISAGSTALFFGQVLQRNGAAFTGTGTKFYEGGLSVGNSPGAASDAGSVNFGSGNLYLAEIGGTEAGTGFDYYNVAGNLAFGGTLKLTSFAGFTGQAGQTFDLFDWGTHSGTFASIDSAGFKLAAGTRLDTSHLYLDGTVSVTAVPEPETYAMLLAGLGVMGAIARRRNGKGNARATH